jgi:hypothetical protein
VAREVFADEPPVEGPVILGVGRGVHSRNPAPDSTEVLQRRLAARVEDVSGGRQEDDSPRSREAPRSRPNRVVPGTRSSRIQASESADWVQSSRPSGRKKEGNQKVARVAILTAFVRSRHSHQIDDRFDENRRNGSKPTEILHVLQKM